MPADEIKRLMQTSIRGELTEEEKAEYKKAHQMFVHYKYKLGQFDAFKEAQRLVADKNAAISINQTDMFKGHIEKKIDELIKNNKKLESLKENARKMSFPNALNEICKQIINLTKV